MSLFDPHHDARAESEASGRRWWSVVGARLRSWWSGWVGLVLLAALVVAAVTYWVRSL